MLSNTLKLFGRNIKFQYLNLAFWLSLGALLILKFFLTSNLGGTQEFLRTYKFMTDDSFDFLANGVRFFESDDISFNNPGLPLIIRILYYNNLLFLLPLLNQLVFGGIIYTIFKTTQNLVKNKWIPYIIASFLFLNYSLQHFANFILADYYGIFLIAISVYFLFKKRFKFSLLLLGASMLFKNFSYFLAPLWLIYIYAQGQPIRDFKGLLDLKKICTYITSNALKLLIHLILLLNFNLIWFTYKFVKFGNPLFTRVTQFELLTPNLNSVLFYLVNSYTLFGPAFFVVAYFLVVTYKRSQSDFKWTFLTASSVVTLTFWVILYDWNDRRFLFYLLPFFYPIFAVILDKYVRKLNIKVQIVLLVLMLYPSTISLGSAFNAHIIPFTNWDKLVFSTYTDKRPQLFITTPISYEHQDFKPLTLIAALNPSYAQLIWYHKYNKFSTDTRYTHYEELINESYNKETKVMCIKDKDLSFNVLNKMLLILENETTLNVKVKKNCKQK